MAKSKLSELVAQLRLAPFSNRFISHLDTAIHHHFLDVPIAQGEGVVEPDALIDNFCWETMTGVHESEVRTEWDRYEYSMFGLS